MIYLGDKPIGLNHNIQIAEVPSEYEQLDYVYFTGLQWINTDYIWNQNSIFRIENTRYPLGMQAFSELIKSNNLYLQYGTAQGVYIKMGSMAEVNLQTNQSIPVYQCSKNIIEFSSTEGNIISLLPGIGYEKKEYTTTITDTGEVQLSNSSRPWHGLIHTFEVLENGILVIRMLPAKRRTDNIIGLYDVVRHRFFTDESGNGF